MPEEVSFIAAVVIGLLGSTHCVGMCGGIVGALSLGLSSEIQSSRPALAGHLLAYNLGRIFSYMMAGAIAGLIGSQFHILSSGMRLPILTVLSGLFIIALGFYLAGWWRGLVVLERGGAVLWRRIEPLGRRFLPVKSAPQALGVGLVWGWLPCGLVYTALVWSLTAESWLQGATLMLGFGLGTLPMLLMMGGMASQVKRLTQNIYVRQGVAVIMLLMGAWVIYNALAGPGHQHGHGHDHSGHDMSMVVPATLPASPRQIWQG